MRSPGDILTFEEGFDHRETFGPVRWWAWVTGLNPAAGPVGLAIQMRERIAPFGSHRRSQRRNVFAEIVTADGLADAFNLVGVSQRRNLNLELKTFRANRRRPPNGGIAHVIEVLLAGASGGGGNR